MNLHSTGIKDQKHKIICQIADIGARSDPPETGVLLPGSVTYKKYIQEIFLIDDTWEHES